MGGDTGNGFDKNPQNINKEGAPKKDWTWAGLIEKEADKEVDGVTKKEKVVEAVMDKAENGDVQAFRELSNRTDGAPKQSQTIDLKSEEIAQLAGAIRALAGKDD